ncbi:TetR/AcrR family transcriptional regulator [Glycomyces arizonensis]|uniref:TetR/AcrR family transcriptional regulator n=1 Tax=Glycomyces arizonensis TaxID=256035 RepID=UPI00047AF12D|nr:helix-turn-helix domain-containing protein [Glycomyces arizonensis]
MRADARRNLQRLLAEARAVFAERGVEASLEDIARRAGVGIGTLYRHFPNRQALIEATFHDIVESLRVSAEQLHQSESTPPYEALMTWIRQFTAYASASRGAVESIQSGVLDGQSPLGESCTAMRASAAGLLARAQDSGAIRPDLDISDLFKLLNGIAWVAEQTPDADVAERLLSLITTGLDVRPERTAR